MARLLSLLSFFVFEIFINDPKLLAYTNQP